MTMSTSGLKRRLTKVEQQHAPAPSRRETVIRTRSDADREAQLAALAEAGRYEPGTPVFEIRRVIVDAQGGVI